MIHLLLLTLALPSVRDLTPPGGGFVYGFSSDFQFACGSGRAGAWVWSEQTGMVLLAQMVDIPATDCYVRQFKQVGSEWKILVEYWPIVTDTKQFLVTLPCDPDQWFIPGDFDRDGDVDQADFGLWQQDPKRMPLSEFLPLMGSVK